MAGGEWDDFGDAAEGWSGGVESGGTAEALTRESLTDQALADSLTRLGSGETSGWMGRVNEGLSGQGGRYDRSTLTVAVVVAAVSVALFVFGLAYFFL